MEKNLIFGNSWKNWGMKPRLKEEEDDAGDDSEFEEEEKDGIGKAKDGCGGAKFFGRDLLVEVSSQKRTNKCLNMLTVDYGNGLT